MFDPPVVDPCETKNCKFTKNVESKMTEPYVRVSMIICFVSAFICSIYFNAYYEQEVTFNPIRVGWVEKLYLLK